MDEATSKGVGNLEKTVTAEELAMEDATEGIPVKNVKSEKSRDENTQRFDD
ncbi:hypothetical protein KZ483_09420 [Paenibacillus sp. sptzw28]|uniref:hypothetical protein n=1 Tax=Paenibacillus sp. sptzw28 TaxID=715179 RepID=UPI001C6F0FF3|nr:hypothetical protein [Paenibacillus sp. sptzw28]QYR23110.1 hypothetical protein KZ483_09420 [Paenibacillus sp. sptzw28]